jgi:hypothetical protein
LKKFNLVDFFDSVKAVFIRKVKRFDFLPLLFKIFFEIIRKISITRTKSGDEKRGGVPFQTIKF